MTASNLYHKSRRRVAVFMSGSGTNAEVLLQSCREYSAYEIAVLVTDNPEGSNTFQLADRFRVDVVALDIRKFYAARGEESIALSSPRRCQLREEWTDKLRAALQPYHIDFAVLAGFVPLCNITADYPCLNVHPGDLTVEENNVRILAGLHFKPVETAILRGFASLRSSVILAQPFAGNGAAEMDAGPVLGISPAVPVDLFGHTLSELTACAKVRIHAPYRDILREVAQKNLENLKYRGDHVVLPPVVEAFAAGLYEIKGHELYYQGVKVRTVEFDGNLEVAVQV